MEDSNVATQTPQQQKHIQKLMKRCASNEAKLHQKREEKSPMVPLFHRRLTRDLNALEKALYGTGH